MCAVFQELPIEYNATYVRPADNVGAGKTLKNFLLSLKSVN